MSKKTVLSFEGKGLRLRRKDDNSFRAEYREPEVSAL